MRRCGVCVRGGRLLRVHLRSHKRSPARNGSGGGGRWAGRSEVRIQLRDVPGDLFSHEVGQGPNEFVLRMQPLEELYLKMTIKKPGCVRAARLRRRQRPSARAPSCGAALSVRWLMRDRAGPSRPAPSPSQRGVEAFALVTATPTQQSRCAI